MAYFNLKVTTFFSGLKLRHLTTLLLLSAEIRLMASTLLLGFWVPEPLWLTSSISNCYQPLRIPSHTSPFLFIPVSRISLWKLKHQSWNSTQIQRGSQATSLPHRAEKGEQVGFTREHLPRRDPDWQSDSSSTELQLSPQAYPGFRTQGRQSRPNTVLVYESELPGRYHNLHVTFKLEENVTSVSVTLITKCARTILPPRAIGKLTAAADVLALERVCSL